VVERTSRARRLKRPAAPQQLQDPVTALLTGASISVEGQLLDEQGGPHHTLAVDRQEARPHTCRIRVS
jgi:hypothetical protein